MVIILKTVLVSIIVIISTIFEFNVWVRSDLRVT